MIREAHLYHAGLSHLPKGLAYCRPHRGPSPHVDQKVSSCKCLQVIKRQSQL